MTEQVPSEDRCNCPSGSYHIKHTNACYEARIERLRQLLWRIQPILNPGSEIAYKVEREVGSVHTNRDGLKS